MISRARAACVKLRGFRVQPLLVEARADRRDRARRQRRLVLGQVGERFERRLRIARAGKFAREVARLRPQSAARPRRETAPAAAASRASASSPCGSRGPRLRRASLVVQDRARFGQDVARDGPETPRRPQHLDARRVSRPCEGSMTAVCHNPPGGRVIGGGAYRQCAAKSPAIVAKCLIYRALFGCGSRI